MSPGLVLLDSVGNLVENNIRLSGAKLVRTQIWTYYVPVRQDRILPVSAPAVDTVGRTRAKRK